MVCTTIWRCFPTSSTRHNNGQPRMLTIFFLSWDTAVPMSCPFSFVLCTPLHAVYHASLAKNFAIEFGIAVTLSCANTGFLGQGVWLVINSPQQAKELNVLEHNAPFRLLPPQLLYLTNVKLCLLYAWDCTSVWYFVITIPPLRFLRLAYKIVLTFWGCYVTGWQVVICGQVPCTK